MSEILIILVAGIFLPLFPMSMVFNVLIEKTKQTWLRAFLFITWPMFGVYIVLNYLQPLPDWILPLALTTSVLYALRMLTLREVTQWAGFLGTSLWSLIWLAIMQDTTAVLLYSYAVGMSVPLVLLALLSAGLEQRYGAAYTGLYGGLARTIPRFSGVLVTVIIAAIATPLFPTFFIMLAMVVKSVVATPFVALILLLSWLLWSWAGANLIQGLIVGRASDVKIADMGIATISFYSLVLLALIVDGLYISGMVL